MAHKCKYVREILSVPRLSTARIPFQKALSTSRCRSEENTGVQGRRISYSNSESRPGRTIFTSRRSGAPGLEDHTGAINWTLLHKRRKAVPLVCGVDPLHLVPGTPPPTPSLCYRRDFPAQRASVLQTATTDGRNFIILLVPATTAMAHSKKLATAFTFKH